MTKSWVEQKYFKTAGDFFQAMETRETSASYQIDRELAAQIKPADSLFMCGFWRSGTTWLQQALAAWLEAKLVFEPLFCLAPDARVVFDAHHVADKKFGYLLLYMPYYDGDDLRGHPLHDFFDRALRSTLGGEWIRKYRRDLAESYRTRTILKCVRSQLCLRAVQNTFGMPVIHIYRDPRAIVASAKMTEWYPMFERLSLRRQLLQPADGRAAFFSQWRGEIQQYDEQDTPARLTAYWALTEKFLQHSYADGRGRFVSVSYEELCRRREKLLQEVLEKLSVRPAAENALPALEGDSSSTSAPRRGASVDDRLTGWKKILSAAEIAAIEAVAQYFGFEERLVS